MTLYGQPEFDTGVVFPSAASLFISPESGTVLGGTEVTITGTSFQETGLDDPLNDSVLNPALWLATTVGKASSAIETVKLRLQTDPTAASSAVVTGLTAVNDTDIEIDFSIVSPVVEVPPSDSVELATLRLYVDANNYAQISRKAGGNATNHYEARTVVSGTTRESALLSTTDLEGSLRIIRQGSTIYLYAGSMEVLRSQAFVSTAAVPVLRADNLSTAYAVVTDFSDFFVHTMVVFGTEPMLDAEVPSDERIVGTTPPGTRVGEVLLLISTSAGPVSTNGLSFVYTDPNTFVIMQQERRGTTLSVTNDTTLRNLASGRPGFLR